MIFKNNQFYLLIILIIIISSIKTSSIKIQKNSNKKILENKKPAFKPFDAVIKFPDLELIKNKNNNNKITKIENHLMKIPLLLKNLILSDKKAKIIYNEKLLDRIKVKYNKKDIKKEKMKTDLLIIVSLVDDKRIKSVSSSLYSLSAKKQKKIRIIRCYIALFKINYNHRLSENLFFYSVLHKVFNVMGFRHDYLAHHLIRNKFENVPLYLIENSKIYQSFQKYLNMKDIKKNIKNDENIISTEFYSSFWNFSNFHDIMSYQVYNDEAITELTLKVFNEMANFAVLKCDLFKYKAGFGRGYNCLRVGQDCIDNTMENEYFLEYGIYNETNIKCYLNDKNHLKNNQCGTKYGNLEYKFPKKYFCPVYKEIKDKPFISMTPIPELNIYKSQKIRLLRNPPSCKKYIPRTIFFSVPPYIFDNEKNNTNVNILINELNEINKNVEYDEIIFEENDKKYFVTYETLEENYKRESVIYVLNYSGLIRSFSDLNSHNLLIKNLKYKHLEKMGMIPNFQKIYSYSNSMIITYKDLIYKNYAIMNKQYPNDYSYMPPSFSYPEEKNIIFQKFKNYKLSPDDLWLIKPKSGSLGKGIYIFKDLYNISDDSIITKYIHNPHLINKYKYDLRVYVLITGLSPLKLYLYKEGIVRFATEEYSLDLNKLEESYIHITNANLNQKNKNLYKKAHDADTEEGSKWSFKAYEKYCNNNGIDYKNIREQMIEISIKSILSVRDLLLKDIKDNGTKDRNHFKLFGYDFLVDEQLKVYLLEINERPSLLMDEINDMKLKPQLVADALNLVGISPFSHDYRDDFEAYDKEININNEEEEMEYDVNNALCEFGKPRGRFELIFPVKSKINYYKQFFGIKKIVDEMLWEKL